MRGVYLIAAVGKQGQLGLNGELPWHDPEDLKFFKETTLGHVIIVGHNTAELLPPLRNRTVLVDQKDVSPEDMLTATRMTYSTNNIFIAGGAKTYLKYRGFYERSYISHIDYDGPADAFMPDLWEVNFPNAHTKPSST